MIYANVNLTVQENVSICDNKILLYRGDKNVQVRFHIKNSPFTVTENTYAQLIIKRPSATSLFSEVSKVDNNAVLLTISEEMIDEIKEIGIYEFQIRLYDDNLVARATLPPCKNCLIIERPIAIEGESIVNYSRINDAVIIAAEDTGEDIFNDDNDYIKTEWVDGDIISDVRMNKIEEAIFQINKKGGSGSGGTSAYISTSLPENVMVKTEEDFELLLDFSSPNIGKGTLKVFVNDTEVVSTRIDQGESSTMIPYSNFLKGNNTVVVYVVDRVGVMSNSLMFYIRYGGTELVPSFDSYSSYDVGSTIRYYFTPSALDTSKDLYLYMTIDGSQQPVITCKSDTRSYFTFPTSLSAGVHKCEAYVTDGTTDSNKHVFNLVLIDDTSIAIATDTYTTTVEEGEQLSIDYKVYSKHYTSFIVKVYVDNKLVSTGSCGLAMNYYNTSSLKEGLHTVKIEAWSNDESTHSYCITEVEITASLFEMYVPVNSGATFIATAQNKSNADENRDKWIGTNQDGMEIEGILNEFVFDTNDGWGNNLLTLNGTANVTIPVQPLKNNALYGFTLDITFKSRQVGVPEAEVLTIWDNEKDCGIKITSEELIFKSAGGKICDLYFTDDEMVNAIFVVDRDQKMAKIYLNGVMCEAFALSDYENNGIKYLEDFAIDSEIYINKFGGYCQIKDLRVYEVALSTEEIINNFISTKTTKSEQQYLVEFQKGNTLPTLTIYCDFSGLGKDDKKPCNIVYNSPDETLYGKSFTLEHKTSQLQYQGTSSMAYPIKNYRLNLRDEDGEKWKYNPYPSGQPEARFTLKADFMSSGHWQNTGLAKWINDNLYHYDSKDEKSMNPAKWYDLQHSIPMTAHRESINGFPCRLILINDGETPLNEGQYEPTPGNTKDMGIFNFNNDKDNTDTLGFNTDIFPYCASYEVTANSDTSAGAFMSYDGDDPEGEVEYLQQSFELRFPDADDVGEDYGYLGIEGVDGTGLKRVIDWVDNCTDEEFVNDFEQYFQKQYTLRYYILVIVLGMVDNLGKNMMLDTFDHKVWMPRFYDMDTICSYDNTGQIKFDVDIEMEQGYWNTSASRLWTRIRDLMHDELVEIYKDLRANGMSYESFMSYFYDEQIAKIPQKYYNMDADVKYLPFADAYIGKAHGDGYEHLKRWLKKRLIFTDTLYDYQPSYINDVLTIRANTTEEMTIEIETYTPLYQHVSWYNGQMDKKKIDGKISVTFNGYAQAATDQEVLIYGGSNIKSIRGISSCNPSQLLIGAATKLVELEAKDCVLLSDINSNGANLLPHTYLTKLDLGGCTALPGILNIQNSPLLRYIDISGSSISSINMPPTLKNIEYMKFENCLGFTQLELSRLYMPKLTSCENMFKNCLNMTSLNLSNWRIPNVTNMDYMFDGCKALTSLDLSNFNTTNVTTMCAMFRNCNTLTSLDVSNFDTTKVTNMSYMFSACNVLTSLDVSNFNTSKVMNMGYMFNECNKLTSLDVSNFYTTNVTDMTYMFNACNALTSLDVSKFNTSKVKNMHAMFRVCNKLTSLDVSNFDTKNVTDMGYMFSACNVLTSLDVSGFDTTKVTDMSNMFNACSTLTSLDVSNFNTTNVTDMSYMFNACNALTSLDVSKFDTTNVENMSYMFRDCDKLISLDVSNFDTTNVTNMSYMFYGCNKLASLDVSNFDTKNVTDMSNIFLNCTKLKRINMLHSSKESVEKIAPLLPATETDSLLRGSVEIDITLLANEWKYRYISDMLLSMYISKSPNSIPIFNSSFTSTNFTKTSTNRGDGTYLIELRRTGELLPTSISFQNITSLIEVLELNTTNVTSMSYMFYNCSALTSLDVFNFYTKNVTDMSNMFYNCKALTSLDLSKFDTANVATMYAMFRNCNKLASLDVSGFDTSNVTDMNNMFDGCKALTSLDVSNFNTSKVETMSYIFQSCNALTSLDVSNFDTKNVTDMSYMFNACNALTSLDLSKFDTTNVTSMNNMFRDCNKLTSLDVSNFNTSNVKNMAYMFYGCSTLTSLVVSNFDTKNVTDMSYMFSTCNALTSLDLSNFDTTNVENMAYIFQSCNKLTSLDVSNFNTSKVTTMSYMFNACNALTSLDVSNFNTTNVTDMSYMFNACNALTSLDLSNFDTTNVTSMSYMFYNCKALTSLNVSKFNTTNVTDMNNMFRDSNKLTTLDVSNFNTSNVKNMAFMFYGCNTLTSLDVSKFDTKNVTDMSNMFSGCSTITSLDLSNFNTTNVKNMAYIFQSCNKLTSLDVSKFDTKNVTNMSYMFRNCSALTSLYVSNFDTKNVTDMSNMFYNCKALTSLDVSNFNTSNVTNMSFMFSECNALTSLDVSNFNTTKVTDIRNMFYRCNALTSLDVSNFDLSTLKSYPTNTWSMSNMLDINPPKNLKLTHAISSMTKLSRDEIVDWLNALAIIESPETITLGTTLLGKLFQNDIAIATNKGWNVA